jgi:hypothetical protein
MFDKTQPTHAHNFTSQTSDSAYSSLDVATASTAPHACTGNCSQAITDDLVKLNCSSACTFTLLNMDFYQGDMLPLQGKSTTVVDAGGTAGTNNITIATAGTGSTINGSSSVTINTNYGVKQILYIGGGNWVAR